MNRPDKNPAKELDANDLLIYLGAAIVAGVGLSWMVLARPWASVAPVNEVAEEHISINPSAPTPTLQALAANDRTIDESLRLAGLAQTAGMLLEPPRYGAWALYTDVLDVDPSNAAARDGVQRVADAVIARAATALEQGRTADARTSVDTVLARLPEHTAAQRMAARIEESTVTRRAQRESPAPPSRAASISRPDVGTGSKAVAATPATPDPLLALRGRFDKALSAGQLLLPDGDSAKYFLSLMADLADGNSAVVEARGSLAAALIQRAAEAAESVDFAAAEIWIHEAIELGADPARIAEAQTDLTNRLIAAESQTPVPAATLTLSDYTPPRYPSTAANLDIEGWVDLEFVVAADGSTTDIDVVAGSHDHLFHQEAVAAVQTWRFEPRIFLDRAIPQKAYTRIRFVFE
jgi:TonB family protein